MDNNSEAFYSRLLDLLQQDSVPPTASPTDDLSGNGAGADMEMDDLDPLDLEELNVAYFSPGNAVPSNQPLNLGEIPTVQNRFHALLKRRLQAEIERHPPLFPWETEISDYSDNVAGNWVPPLHWWMPQVYSLNLPVSLPETVLSQLLDACSETVQAPLQQGAKMVRAVGSMFPDQSKASLNQLAGLVLLYPTRSSQEEQLFSKDYETATDDQKMALSLLAAREIVNALTLSVSPSQTPVERQWQTSFGAVSLQAQYLQERVPKLRVQSRLPKGGSLTLRTGQSSATAQCTYPGYLSVESFDLQPRQTYSLEICFQELEQKPLIFAIKLTAGNREQGTGNREQG